jgi:glutaredoxin
VKTYLAVRGIDFEAIDITSEPSRLERLVALGARTTPVVAIGDRWVGGAAFDRLDEFVRTGGASGAARAEEQTAGTAVGDVFAAGARVILDEPALLDRVDGFLHKAETYIRQIPPPRLNEPLPVRGEEGRTVRGLAYHIGQVARDPLRAANGVPIVKAMHEYDTPDDLDTADALADIVVEVRERLDEWWSSGVHPPADSVVDYFQGPYTIHGLLERCTWHVATHLRQLGWLLVEWGVNVDAGLTADEVRGLPMPRMVWK